MKTSIIADCVKSSNGSGYFTHISNDMENTTNSSKLSIDIGNSNFLELEKLNLSDLKTHKITTLIIGKREVGKTQLIKHIMVQMKNNNLVDSFVIFTSKYNKLKYNDLCVSTDKIINKHNDIYIIKNLIDYQTKNPTNKLMIIFDDFIMNKKILSSELFNDLILNKKHYNIGIIISLQFSIGLTPQFRTLIDLVMVYKDEFILNNKKTYEYYFGIISSFKLFNQIINGLNSYECLITDFYIKKHSFNDKVKYYKSNYISPNETNKIELFNVKIIDNENKINKKNSLMKILEENKNKIKILMNENVEITNELSEL